MSIELYELHSLMKHCKYMVCKDTINTLKMIGCNHHQRKIHCWAHIKRDVENILINLKACMAHELLIKFENFGTQCFNKL